MRTLPARVSEAIALLAKRGFEVKGVKRTQGDELTYYDLSVENESGVRLTFTWAQEEAEGRLHPLTCEAEIGPVPQEKFFGARITLSLAIGEPTLFKAMGFFPPETAKVKVRRGKRKVVEEVVSMEECEAALDLTE